MVTEVLLEPLVHKASRALRVTKEHMEIEVQLVQKVHKDLWV
jgi:hypothetical protein